MVFVGREGEVRVLTDAVARAESDQQLQTVLVTGAPGAGKTATIRHVLSQLESRLVSTLVTHYDNSVAPPFWTWTAIIRTLESSHAQWESVRASLACIQQEAVRHLVEQHDELARAGPPPDRRRFELFDATTSVISRLAASSPVVLLLDNLHAVDAGSLALLNHLVSIAPECALTLIATARTGESRPRIEVSQTMALLRARANHVDVRLAGFSKNELAELVESHGIRNGEPVVASMWEMHVRLPLHAQLFVRSVATANAGTNKPADHLTASPWSLREAVFRVVAAELASAGEEARLVLRASALAGAIVTRELLDCCVVLDQVSIERAIARALDLGILVSADDEPPVVRFSHDLIRQAVVADMPDFDRTVLAEAIADAAEKVWQDAPGERSTQLRELWSWSATEHAKRRFLHHTILAVQHAIERLSWEDAIALVTDARVARCEPVAHDQATLLSLEAVARCRTGDRSAARATALRALDQLIAQGRGHEFPNLFDFDYSSDVNDPDALMVCEKAMRATPRNHPSYLPIRCHYIHGVCQGLGDYSAADRLLRQTEREFTNRLGPHERMNIYPLWAHIDTRFGRLKNAEAHLRAAWPADGTMKLPTMVVAACETAAAELALMQGRLADEERLRESSRRAVLEQGPLSIVAFVNYQAHRMHGKRGNWARTDELRAEMQRMRWPDSPGLDVTAIALYHQGRFDEGDQVLEWMTNRLDEQHPGLTLYHAHLATTVAARVHISGETRFQSDGVSAIDYALHFPRQHPLLRLRTLWAACLLAHDLSRAGRPLPPGMHHGDLKRYAHELRSTRLPGLLKAHHRYYAAGVAYAELGDYSEAARLLREAASTSEFLGDLVAHAYALSELAAILERMGAGAAEEAAAVRETASQAAYRLRLDPLSQALLDRRHVPIAGDVTVAPMSAGASPARFTLTLFGPPRLRDHARELRVRRRKSLGLLAYLAMEPGAHMRARLAELLWPTTDTTHSLGSLRSALHDITTTADLLLVTSESVSFRHEQCRVDALALAETAALVDVTISPDEDSGDPATVEASERAASLVQGEFLRGFEFPDAQPFDDWLFFTSESLQTKLSGILEWLVRYYTKRDTARAITYARRLIQADELNEDYHRELIELYVTEGRYRAAIRQFDWCSDVIRRELNEEPSADLRALYDAIRGRGHGHGGR